MMLLTECRRAMIAMAMGVMMLVCAAADGVVVDLNAQAWWEDTWDPRLTTQLLSWDFDYDTQTLTLTQAFYRIPNNSDYWDKTIMRSILISGYAEGQSTFTIIENTINLTDVAWTGYELVFGTTQSDDITSFVAGSATSNSFSAVSDDLPIILSEGVVFPGETLTIEYSVLTDSPLAGRGTNIVLYATPIPEPVGILMLGCGGMMLLRKRRVARR